MPESYGDTFPTVNVQQGHRHEGATTGLVYRYIGGDPANQDNWLVDGGRTSTDPDMSSWNTRQSGAHWYNTSKRINQYWTGTHLRSSVIQDVSISGNAASIDTGDGSHFRILLDQDLSSLTLIGDFDGQRIMIEAIQDATGNRVITWPSNVRFSTDLAVEAFVANTAAESSTYFGLIYNGARGVFDAVAITKGF